VPDHPDIYTDEISLNVQELHEIYEVFPGSESSESMVFSYNGLKFSLLEIIRFFPPAPPNLTGEYSSPELALMKSGPWTVALTEGIAGWGDFPPAGTTLEGTVATELKPASLYWTDAKGSARAYGPIWDGEAIYLAIEFIFVPTDSLTVKELELRLDGDRVHYRRFSLPVENGNTVGFLMKVRGNP